MKNANTPSKSVYESIATDLIARIDKGIYNKGDKLPSRNELCDHYKISDKTAFRVQEYLVGQGIVYTVKGKGVFVNKISALQNKQTQISSSAIDKIVCFDVNSYKEGHSASMIFKGVQQESSDIGINIRGEFLNNKTSKNVSLNMKENEGVIIIAGSREDYLLPLTINSRIKSVVVDNVFSGSYCVLTDNYSGITQIIDHLQRKKCKHLIMATKFFDSLGLANRSERIYAFENESCRRNLKHQVIRNGNYDSLLELVKSTADSPDAILFTSDRPALKFKKMLKELNIKKKILVTGFDGIVDIDGANELTTVKVNFEDLGKTAVKILINNKLDDWSRPEIMRVPCKLIPRD